MRRLRNLVLGPSPEPGVVPKTWFRQFLPADPVIIDCGAHEGYDTQEFSRLFPNGRIHSFEPLPSVFERLRQRNGSSPNVRLYPLALGDREGTATFHVSGGTPDRPASDVNQSSSLLPPQETLRLHPHIRFEQTIEVPVATLDGWAEREGVSRVDLLWLDMQGFEGQFLAASPRMLKGVRVIHSEVHRIPNYSGSILYPELTAWLKERGFVLVREEIPWDDGGNAVFAQPEFIPSGGIRS